MNKPIRITCFLALIFSINFNFHIIAQEEGEGELFDLSLSDMMNIDIVSASKKKETLFNAPVSSYSITRAEISKSGVTSIPEALRLAPGVIVRETSNGNYDIHIRGLDNLARFTGSQEQINTITLVMIDNRPVYNYNQGGTLWESLPVDLVDVEQIEVVRGPSAPLFGPNAVSGVINIITTKPKDDGFYTSGNVQYGSSNTLVGNLAVGGKVYDDFNFIVSGNLQQRDRQYDLYYDYVATQYATSPATLPTVIDIDNNTSIGFLQGFINKYPDTELAMDKFGVNAFANFTPTEDVSLELSAGYQDATVQKVYLDDYTPLTFSENNSFYINAAAKIKGFGAKMSYLNGFNDIELNSLEFIFKYDFVVTDVVLDYALELGDKLTVTPTFNYQNAVYDATNYATESAVLSTLIEEEENLSAIAGALRIDYSPVEQLRLIGAVRTDKFNIPDDSYISYQFASTYKVGDGLLFRAVHSRSNSGGFVANTLLDAGLSRGGKVKGDEELKLSVNTMTEFGLRAKVTEGFGLDLSLFTQKIGDLNSLIRTGSTPPIDEDGIPIVLQFTNLPLEATQTGATISLNFVDNSGNLQVRPFITYQTTNVDNLPVDANVSLTNTIDDKNNSTPDFYGGAFVNYNANNRLNINLSSYFYSEFTQYHNSNTLLRPLTETEQAMNAKVILNAKVSYKIVDELKLYVNARNFNNNDNREYFAADRTKSMFLGGLSYNF